MNATPSNPLRFWIKRFGILLVVFGCLVLFSIRYFNKISVCSRLKPGITLNDMIERFGSPIDNKAPEPGRWVFFKSTIGAAGPIRVKLDDQDRVVVLRCNEDGPPTWTLEQK